MAADRLPDPESKCECGHTQANHEGWFHDRECSGTVYTDAPLGGGGCYPCPCRGFAPVSAAVSPAEPPAAIPGADPGACPKCGHWVKAGMIHACPLPERPTGRGDIPPPSVSPADTIRRALGHLEEWDGVSPAQVEDEEAACRALDDLLAGRERDRRQIAQLTEALAFYADLASYRNATPRTVRPVIDDFGARARAVLAGEEDARP